MNEKLGSKTKSLATIKKTSAMSSKYQTVDEYISQFSDDKQKALNNLRAIIKEAAPEATEKIAYGVPMFQYLGNLIGFGGAKNHCSLYGATGSLVKDFESELNGFEISKGTIRFTVDKPIPKKLIIKIVKQRLNENIEKNKSKTK